MKFVFSFILQYSNIVVVLSAWKVADTFLLNILKGIVYFL